jgi:hypothetical protein
MVESAPSSDRARLIALIHGYRSTCIIATAVEAGILDALLAGPSDEARLAQRLGVHRPSLRRLLRGLQVLGLTQTRAGGVTLTPMGRLLVEPDAGVRERARLAGAEYLPAWHNLRHSLDTGEPAYDITFGTDAWERRRQHPELGACVNRTMVDDQRRTGRSIAAAYDFSGLRLIVDVGGGEGALLADILAQWPQPAGLLFDQPHVVAGAAKLLAAAGFAPRCRIVGGSFFEAVPAGGDAYVLQHILHNWNDERCREILGRVHAAMDARGVLLVIENVLPDDEEPTAHLALLDLHMMVMLGGRERTRGEYRSLLDASGFELVRSISTTAGPEILEAVPLRRAARPARASRT